ncbi:MAG: Xaa-Pro dipeptidyl-peptidase [Gemmatimonadetes bacterium]|nr:Xaa-Pro dipeptidyl-peptidase [Gemmatimonadota bacterium]
MRRAAHAACALWAASLGALAACAQSPRPTLPVFRDGQAQVVPGFANPAAWVRHELWVETEFDSDGDGRRDRMHVAVTRPPQTDSEGLRVPVVYETSPYFEGVGSTAPQYFWNVRHELGTTPPPRVQMPEIAYVSPRPVISNSQVGAWVPRGFAVVHSESPGTGLSQGCPTIGGRNETLAPKAVIDWLNGRARGFATANGDEEVRAYWSSGKVGMTGTSYNGTLPLAAATTGVDGLEAIIPVSANTSYYNYYRSNGLVRSPGGYLGEDVDVLFDFVDSGDPARRDYCVRTVREGELAAGQDRESGDYNDFWAGRDYLGALAGVRAATLLAHGLGDWNVMPGHSVRVYEALRDRGVPVQLYLHQGGHGGEPPMELMNRWFTRYLHGVENGVERDPRAWVVREGAPRGAPVAPTSYPDYPHPDAAGVTLRLGAGGESVGGLALEIAAGQGTESLTDDVALGGAALARAASMESRLLYATPELERPVHISGTPSVTIRVSASRPAANLSVWLVTLPWLDQPNPVANVITRGWADPQNHSSLTRGEPLEPGRFYDVTFELEPDDQVIAAGKRIGLMIFASDREFTLWPPAGTELRVDLDATRLVLPVVGGAEALAGALR